MDFKDYYQTLGIAKSASAKEIKQAYRKLARKHHPDVNPGDATSESKFKDITEAYEVLGNAETRRKYDELGANWRQYEQAPGGPGGGANPFGSGWPFGDGRWTVNMGGAEARAGGAGDPFSDFFHTFFGGAHEPQRRRAPRNKGRDVEQSIDLTLEEALHGVQRRFSIATRGQARTVDVKIPPGVSDGSRVRIAGEGEAGVGGAAAGDVFLRVRIAEHPKFRREGRDLHTPVDVALTTAVLGGTVEVPTLEGPSLTLKIPPATQPGQVFRLKGQGMPGVRSHGERGALYATVTIEVPRRLSDEQREHYEALAEIERPGKSGRKKRRARSNA
ncbi:MAG: J domain-containing protein [Vicinamibacterales bacterium]|jgi:DnaJ-class molecular chaperone|nr:J domain-containing protein [Vicinamibacterales bacterium]MDP6609852.1 J domain-containing protein [Vicinamibacterales bacterium]